MRTASTREPVKRSRSISVVLLVLLSVAGCTTTATPQQERTADPDPGRAADMPADDPAPFEEVAKELPNPPDEPPFTYDPGNRRDPFVSPFEVIKGQRGPRPAGVTGMSVDDLDLTGIVAPSGMGSVAYVTGSDGGGYMLRVGDRIYMATVLAIDAGAGSITFREQVDDPRSIKPYRDRVLRLGSAADYR